MLGPTIDFAVSLRGNMEDEAPGKQAIWKHFAVRRIGNEPSKVVELSQGLTPNRLKIRLDRYQPKDTDKQYYLWFNNEGVQQKYHTPAYGIENLGVAQHAIEGFLRDNSEVYIEAHLKDATEITRKTFHTAQQNKVSFISYLPELLSNDCQHLPLVERALKLWVGCRFIEDPWSIVGNETLSQVLDPNPACPYHTKIPVPPIVDLQLDLIVINELLQPELKKILKMLKTLLESSDPWNNWFEIYLSYFILLHNVELTMAHDAWFVRRNNLKVRSSLPHSSPPKANINQEEILQQKPRRHNHGGRHNSPISLPLRPPRLRTVLSARARRNTELAGRDDELFERGATAGQGCGR